MKNKEDNIIVVKSTDFALQIIALYKDLVTKNLFALGQQILKSGTSIGANIREGMRAQSKADFISKLNISLKEAAETEYWLELLYKGGFMSFQSYELLNANCLELTKILTSIIISSKRNS